MSPDVTWMLSVMDSRGHVTFMTQNSQVKCVNVPCFGFLFVCLIRLLITKHDGWHKSYLKIMQKRLDCPLVAGSSTGWSFSKYLAADRHVPVQALQPSVQTRPARSAPKAATKMVQHRQNNALPMLPGNLISCRSRSCLVTFKAKLWVVKLPERRSSWRLLFCSFVFLCVLFKLAIPLSSGEKARAQCILGYAIPRRIHQTQPSNWRNEGCHSSAAFERGFKLGEPCFGEYDVIGLQTFYWLV